MDWMTIITSATALLEGGIILRMATLKSAKRKAGAEADNAGIDALKNAISELRELQTESGAREDKLNAQIAERDAKIEKLHGELSDKRCENTTKGYYMCVHQGCVVRCPSLGRGKEYYKQHVGEDDFGADYYTIEELLEMRKAEGRKAVKKGKKKVAEAAAEMSKDIEG